MYNANKLVTPAAYPRQVGSTIFDAKLKLCYRKYTPKYETIQDKKILVNLVFIHGTGMNKGIWRYHIENLYRLYNSEPNSAGIGIGNVLTPDMVNHADSAALNQENLGEEMFDWIDGARDVVEMIKFEDKAFKNVGFKNVNIIVGHSMGGFISVITQYLNPGLFHAVVPLNLIMYYPEVEGLHEISAAVFKDWETRGFMRDKFEIVNSANRFEVSDAFFRKRSFYRKFHPKVLEYLLDDDIYEEGECLEAKGDTTHVYTKTTVKDQLITYCSASVSVPVGMKLYKKIDIPVYYILSSEDNTLPEAKSFFVEQLKHVIRQIDCKGKHIVNGEDPDLIIKIIQGIIEERVLKDGPKVEELRPTEQEFDAQQVERRRRQAILREHFEKRTAIKL